MKVKELIEQLQNFNPEAEIDMCAQHLYKDETILTTMYGTIDAVERREGDDNPYLHMKATVCGVSSYQ